MKFLTKNILVYVLTVAIAIGLLFGASALVQPDVGIYAEGSGEPIQMYAAHIDRIIGSYYEETTLGIASKVITFEANVKDGPYAGRSVVATQRLDGLLPINQEEVSQGADVFLAEEINAEGESVLVFSEYQRTDPLLFLGIAFLALLIVFGRREGVNTVLSLVLTCLAIFMVFIPSVLCGWNIYFMAIATCVYVIVVTLLLVSGFTRKTAVASVGCLGGLAVAGILTTVMSAWLHLSGAPDEDAVYLLFLDTPSPIDLKAIIFAAIMIGAMGAVMDVAMSLSSALQELMEKAPDISRRELIRSGFTIGRDMMATMSNTLILAYIGCALSVVLLLVSYNSSFTVLFNKEMIAVEILQALVGSLAILSTIPITTCVASYLYAKKKQPKEAAAE